MPVSAANSQVVFDALKANGVRLMSALPETWLVPDSLRATEGTDRRVLTSPLTAVVADLAAGRITVIDLTQPLAPDTPVIGLPPMFAASPGVSIDVVSKYDDKGPAWYWNSIHMGEHSGTHFDAPVHWISGRDLPNNTTDTIPARQFVGPACVIDIAPEVAAKMKTTCWT